LHGEEEAAHMELEALEEEEGEEGEGARQGDASSISTTC
jgi:hypothetical protein